MSISGVSTAFSRISPPATARTSDGVSFGGLLNKASAPMPSASAGAVTADTPKTTGPLTEEQQRTKLKEAIAALEKELRLTPAQRARRAVLKNMQLTEGALNAMPPAMREATEQAIAVSVAKLLRLDKPLRTDVAAGDVDPVTLLTSDAGAGVA